MLIRQIFVAAVAAGAACAAQADVIPAAATAGSATAVLSGWTGANGTNVLSSGVLAGNLSLIGGLSYSEASKASGGEGSATLADVLLGKAAVSVGQTSDGQTQLFYKQGIDGMYLLGAGHGILAAMLGNGVSVVGSSGGVVVSQGTGPGTTGGVSGGLGGGGASVGGAGSGGYTGGYGGGSTGGSSGGSTGGGSGTTGGLGVGGGGIVSVPAVIDPLPGTGGTGNIGGGISGNTGGTAGAPSGEVPEPSSIALMMAGLLGAGSLVRRRRG
jgi:hypothetical protein